jgi:hypothetical protein
MDLYGGLYRSILYVILRYVDYSYVQKKVVDTKSLVKEAIFVFVASIVGDYVISKTASLPIKSVTPDVFTGNPEF